MTWINDKKWSDQYLTSIKRILGEHLIGEPPIEEDQERNTDLIVLNMTPIRIACRIRRHHHLKKYANEFTIRATRPQGNKTELAKIMEGWGDYLFYGFSPKSGTIITYYHLCSLNVFRLWFNKYMAEHEGDYPGFLADNKDNSSQFLAIDYSMTPADFILAQSKVI